MIKGPSRFRMANVLAAERATRVSHREDPTVGAARLPASGCLWARTAQGALLVPPARRSRPGVDWCR